MYLKRIAVTLLFLASVLLIITPRLNSFLAKNYRVKANTLVIEGWLSPRSIELAYRELLTGQYQHVFTIGLDAPDYFPVVMNGYLVFYTGQVLTDSDPAIHSIEVEAYSELSGEHCSHFNFYINDSVVEDFCVGTESETFGIEWTGRLSEIDSIMVQFDNDAMGDFGDHNLHVKELTIDHHTRISYKNHSDYNRTARGWEKRFHNNYTTYADIARNRLLAYGIDSSKVVSVPGCSIHRNRTLSAAVALREYVDNVQVPVEGINVISLGSHSRRTWMTYNSVLEKNYEIGIIALAPDDPTITRTQQILNNYKELGGIVYYWLILMPYR